MTLQPALFPQPENQWRNDTGVTTPKQDKRYRFQLRFWLNLEKSEESWLADYIAFLKAKRNFQDTVRLGLRLIYDLRQGKTDVLLELFPFVAEVFAMEYRLNEERLAELIAARLNGRTVEAATPLLLADDDTMLFEVKETSGGDAIENFLTAAGGLQQIQSIAGAAINLPVPVEDED